MTLLLRDDGGFTHLIERDVRPEAIPDLIEQAKETGSELGRQFGFVAPPIEVLQAGRLVAL